MEISPRTSAISQASKSGEWVLVHREMGRRTPCRKQSGAHAEGSGLIISCLSLWVMSSPIPWCNPQVCSQRVWIWTLESHWAFGTLIIPDSHWFHASPHILSSFYHGARIMAFKYAQSGANIKHKIKGLFDTFGTAVSQTPWCNLGYSLV